MARHQARIGRPHRHRPPSTTAWILLSCRTWTVACPPDVAARGRTPALRPVGAEPTRHRRVLSDCRGLLRPVVKTRPAYPPSAGRGRQPRSGPAKPEPDPRCLAIQDSCWLQQAYPAHSPAAGPACPPWPKASHRQLRRPAWMLPRHRRLRGQVVARNPPSSRASPQNRKPSARAHAAGGQTHAGSHGSGLTTTQLRARHTSGHYSLAPVQAAGHPPLRQRAKRHQWLAKTDLLWQAVGRHSLHGVGRQDLPP